MFQHRATYVLMVVGIAGLLFSLGRTYYLIRRERRERDFPRRRVNPPAVSPGKHPDE